ncbi:acyl-CoA thioesterase [Pseudarthrobacter sp. NPDC092419]|uniref:acyl-CoA thioesterase n=1 Tax=Pseudarthrobacter sp. NPDC092419 TaxID=3364414 RepID=UPI0038100A02
MVSVRREPDRPCTFVGNLVPGPKGRIFGGQLIGQAVMAASATVEDISERLAHSLHTYFVRAGDASLPIHYDVETIRDGRSFSVRGIRANQKGRLLLTATMSFHATRVGLEHQTRISGRYPDPEDLPNANQGRRTFGSDIDRFGHRDSVELRRVPSELDPGTSGDNARQSLWLRARGATARPNHTDAVSSAALAMATDFTVLESVIFRHGLTLSTPGLSLASLDHSMWWHAPAGLDEWLLYVQESPWAGGERGLVVGRLYNRGGELVASVAQEGMIRVPASEIVVKAHDAR